jgi:hypothetical protein
MLSIERMEQCSDSILKVKCFGIAARSQAKPRRLAVMPVPFAGVMEVRGARAHNTLPWSEPKGVRSLALLDHDVLGW